MDRRIQSRERKAEVRTVAEKVLVAYATRYGSTREVAEAVAARLRERGVGVDVKPVKAVRDLGGRGGVVLATPFYLGSMLKDATHFLERNRAALESLPVAVLACGPVSAEGDMAGARQQLDDALAKLEWLKPVAAEMFVGKYDPAHLRIADRLIATLPASPMHGLGPHDDRDWESVRAWADALPAAIGLA
jgi:menaquinone-dependent protoporphyrinogen oxidase